MQGGGIHVYFNICPICGANLDPGEPCDCQGKEEAASGRSRTESGAQECSHAPKIANLGGNVNEFRL